MFRRWRNRVPACRRAIALLVLGGFVVTFVGVPVPILSPDQGSAQSVASTTHRCCCQSKSDGAGECCGNCGCGKRKSATTVAAGDVSQFELVLSIAARKCQGHAEVWLALGAIALPPERAIVKTDGTCRENLAANPATLTSLGICPATPPPRV